MKLCIVDDRGRVHEIPGGYDAEQLCRTAPRGLHIAVELAIQRIKNEPDPYLKALAKLHQTWELHPLPTTEEIRQRVLGDT